MHALAATLERCHLAPRVAVSEAVTISPGVSAQFRVRPLANGAFALERSDAGAPWQPLMACETAEVALTIAGGRHWTLSNETTPRLPAAAARALAQRS
jgi:hypothetical protein